MNISESSGETSSKRKENGDISSECERPLKKARFAWQVKGKCRLKNESNEELKSGKSIPDTQTPVSSSNKDNDSHALAESTEQNLEILGDYLLKQDFNTLDSVITDSEKSILKPFKEVNTENIQYPTYIASYDNNNTKVPTRSPSTSCDSFDSDFTPMVEESSIMSEEICIARWQERQMAKGFVDNTINRVLESWMIAPWPTDLVNRLLALDVEDFISNLPGDNSIENEGILMAISAHGLQNTSMASDNTLPDIDLNSNLSTSSLEPMGSQYSSNDDFSDISQSNEQNSSENHSKCWSSLNSSNLNSDLDNTENMKSDPENIAVTPVQSLSEGSSTGQEECTDENLYSYYGDNQEDIFHFDFMDAAVSFAIQNKGLTSYGADYG